MRKEKKQIIGEDMSDQAVELFLLPEPADETPPALYKLVKAYRGLRPHDFERFVERFVAAGFDPSARDAAGRGFAALVGDQRQAQPYLEILRAAQAR